MTIGTTLRRSGTALRSGIYEVLVDGAVAGEVRKVSVPESDGQGGAWNVESWAWRDAHDARFDWYSSPAWDSGHRWRWGFATRRAAVEALVASESR